MGNVNSVNIEYRPSQVRDLKVVMREREDGRQSVSSVEVGGEAMEPSPRFWKSLFQRFGLSGNVFR